MAGNMTGKVTCGDDDSPLLSSRVHKKAARNPSLANASCPNSDIENLE